MNELNIVDNLEGLNIYVRVLTSDNLNIVLDLKKKKDIIKVQ